TREAGGGIKSTVTFYDAVTASALVISESANRSMNALRRCEPAKWVTALSSGGSKVSHSHTNLLYHIVFSTQERQPWLDAETSARLYAYLGGAIRSEGGTSLSINGCTDHIHILAKLRQDKAVSEVLRGIKANSSGWIHRTFRPLRAFAWQKGYGAFSVSQSQVDKVKRYIAGQQRHHQRVS